MNLERKWLVTLLAVPMLLVASCGSPADDSAASDASATSSPAAQAAVDEDHGDEEATDHAEEDAADHADEEATDHGDASFAFGEPADADEADRTVSITATDQMAFDPPTVAVRAGEVITFEVTNAGQIPHDFTLGDEHTQQEHAREMEEMGADMAHNDPNAMTLDPGETAAITWRFTEAGEVLYGCHQPGHYDAGMVGAVEVGS